MLSLPVADATAGYRAYRTSALADIDLASVRADGYGFQIEMTHRVERNGGRIVEVPIAFTDRTRGHVEDVEPHRRGGAVVGHPVGGASADPGMTPPSHCQAGCASPSSSEGPSRHRVQPVRIASAASSTSATSAPMRKRGLP